MTQEELYWLAGWLEGEGGFVFGAYRRRSGHTHRQWRIMGTTTDSDIAKKVARLIGGNARGPYQSPSRPDNHKPIYQIELSRRLEVLEMVRRLRSLMGKRRRDQIDVMLREADRHPIRVNYRTRAANGQFVKKPKALK